MARPGFKRRWTKFIPEPIERSTYVLLSSLLLILLFWQWRPILGVVWDVTNPVGTLVLTAFFWAGWLLVLLSTFVINHFDLFGLRQVYLFQKGKQYTNLVFKKRFFYKFVRHPLLLGFIIAFWALNRIKKEIKRVTGSPPTDVAAVCCNPQGNYWIYIGLLGNSIRTTPHNPCPRES